VSGAWDTGGAASRRRGRHAGAVAGRTAGVLIAATLLCGCATSSLDRARGRFYAGQAVAAEQELADIPPGNTDRVLYLMERGTAAQAAGRYEASIRDWLEAADTAEDLDYLSVSRGSASLVVNDRVLAFRGEPYERTLLHTFAAQSFLALGRWEDAAVEARRIARRLEALDGFPDDAFSHYVAGFCFEAQDDLEAAAIEYGRAARLLPAVPLDPATGRFAAGATNAAPPAAGQAELVCCVLIGRSASGDEFWNANLRWGLQPYAEVYAGNRLLGRSYTLTSVQRLIDLTRRKRAAMQTAKTVSRIAVKETLAHAVSRQDSALGDVTRLLLFALETPDERRWETLPLHLGVLRAPCPEEATELRVVFRGAGGRVVEEQTLRAPLSRRGRLRWTMCRAL